MSDEAFGTHDGVCCGSCEQDREAGYGSDIGNMCCCRALDPLASGTLAVPSTRKEN